MEKNTKISPLQVPNGYFENLSERIISGVKASESNSDLSENSILHTKIEKEAIAYEVKEHYFSQFSEKLMSTIHSSNEAENYLTASFGKPNTYSVENGYFESFADRIQHRIQETDEDLIDSTEIIGAIPKAMPFALPEKYFDTFTIPIPNTTSTKKIDFQPATTEANQKKSSIQKNFFKSMRWSSSIAASVVLLILGWGAFMMLNNSDSTSNPLLSNTTANSINLENKDANSSSMQYALNELEKVSNEDILEYLEENTESEDVFYIMDFYAKSEKKNKNETPTNDELLNQVSKEALESYLENEGLL